MYVTSYVGFLFAAYTYIHLDFKYWHQKYFFVGLSFIILLNSLYMHSLSLLDKNAPNLC